MAGGRPAIFESVEQLEKAIAEYFDTTVKKTITGLAYHLGFESRQSFYDYQDREEFSYSIKRARLRIEMYYEEKLTENNCTGPIFALKNMSWKDKTEVDNRYPDGILLQGVRPAENAPMITFEQPLVTNGTNGKGH
jgi:DNA-packaging protein gp3